MGGRGNPGAAPPQGRGGMSNGHNFHNGMSAMNGYGYYPQSVNSSSQKELPLRMLVPSDMVGAIIGKAGATIKQITLQSRARVDVHRKDANAFNNEGQYEKVIYIYGSLEQCASACMRILEVMHKELEKPSGEDETPRTPEPNESTSISLKILSQNDLVGRVIGKHGAVIRKIMEETNAKISVSNVHDPHERVIVITGTIEEMSSAQTKITQKMRQCYDHDLQQAQMMGTGAYGGGPSMANAGARGMNHNMAGHPGAYAPTFQRNGIPPPVMGPHSSNGVHQGNYYSPYGHMGVPPQTGQFYPPGDGTVETVHVWVPACTVGAIIGSRGTSIREIIRSAVCSVKVAPTSPKVETKTKDESKEGSGENSGSEKDPTEPEADAAASAAEDRDTPVQSPPGSQANNGRFAANFANSRKVTLVGPAEAQWRAQCLLYRKIFFESAQHFDLNPETTSDPLIRAGHLRIEISIPSSQVGRLIGKGGQTVKELQRITHATIKLPDDMTKSQTAEAEPTAETPVYIIGDFYAVQAAQRQIRALVARSYNGNAPHAANAKKKEETVAQTTQKVEGDCNTTESQC